MTFSWSLSNFLSSLAGFAKFSSWWLLLEASWLCQCKYITEQEELQMHPKGAWSQGRDCCVFRFPKFPWSRSADYPKPITHMAFHTNRMPVCPKLWNLLKSQHSKRKHNGEHERILNWTFLWFVTVSKRQQMLSSDISKCHVITEPLLVLFRILNQTDLTPSSM